MKIACPEAPRNVYPHPTANGWSVVQQRSMAARFDHRPSNSERDSSWWLAPWASISFFTTSGSRPAGVRVAMDVPYLATCEDVQQVTKRVFAKLTSSFPHLSHSM